MIPMVLVLGGTDISAVPLEVLRAVTETSQVVLVSELVTAEDLPPLGGRREIPPPKTPPTLSEAVWTQTRRRAYQNLKGRNRRRW